MRTATLLASFLLLSGCATEDFMVNTYPEGTRVTINDSYAGVTPLEYKVPRDKIRALRYRIEKDGSRPVSRAPSKPRVSAGRIIGTMLTADNLRAFRGWRVYDELLVDLQPISLAKNDRPAADRLEEIESIYERGLLSDREYKRMRAEILDELRGVQGGPAAPIPFVEE